jgi:hypothetical protein
MPKIHYFQRYATEENSVTNNTLLLIGRIYGYSPATASRLLTDLTGESIEIGIGIHQQVRKGDAIPDGVIEQRDFRILIEAKVKANVLIDQLLRHATKFHNEEVQVLLLVTKRPLGVKEADTIAARISTQSPGVVFRSITYSDICSSIADLFQPHEAEMQDLVQDYLAYCLDCKLIDRSQTTMRIVPCGKSYDINVKNGVYFHPSDRGYSPHAFTGLYRHKRIGHLWRNAAVYDAEIVDGRLVTNLVDGKASADHDSRITSIIADAQSQCGYDVETNHRFFVADEVLETDLIKTSPGGIMGSRLMDLERLVPSWKGSADLAVKLRSCTWS